MQLIVHKIFRFERTLKTEFCLDKIIITIQMKFCPACRNMLFGIDEDVVDGTKTAVLTCRKCEFKESITNQNSMVYEHVLREDKTARLVLNLRKKSNSKE